MPTTQELIQQLGLGPGLDWQQGWKVVSRYVDPGRGKVSYTSYSCPRPLAYIPGIGTTKYFGEGPLTGFRSVKAVEEFAEDERLGWKDQAVFAMLYTPYQGDDWVRNGIYCAVWQNVMDREFGSVLRWRGPLLMPPGTVFSQTIVIYGEEVEI